MTDGLNGILVCFNQAQRIKEHPFETEESLIVSDNLEAGKLRIFEYISGPLTIQQLLWDNYYRNSVLIAEMIINEDWKENGIFIQKVICNYGYEYLMVPMLNQVLHFYEFYNDPRPMKISKKAFDSFLPYAEDTLTDFKQEESIYIYHRHK